MKLYLNDQGRFVGTLAAAGNDPSRIYHVPTDKSGLIELLNRLVETAITTTANDKASPKVVTFEELMQIVPLLDQRQLGRLLIMVGAKFADGDNK